MKGFLIALCITGTAADARSYRGLKPRAGSTASGSPVWNCAWLEKRVPSKTGSLHAVMPAFEQALLTFFRRVAKKDPAVLQRLATFPGFELDSECWRFKLPDLHLYLIDHEPTLQELDYRRFRSLLFRCPVNRSIELLGAHVEITDNLRKVDRSTYALFWDSPGNGSRED